MSALSSFHGLSVKMAMSTSKKLFSSTESNLDDAISLSNLGSIRGRLTVSSWSSPSSSCSVLAPTATPDDASSFVFAFSLLLESACNGPLNGMGGGIACTSPLLDFKVGGAMVTIVGPIACGAANSDAVAIAITGSCTVDAASGTRVGARTSNGVAPIERTEAAVP